MVFFVVEHEQVTEDADMLMWLVVEWKAMLAEGTVVWNDFENNVVKMIKGLLTALSHRYVLFY